jgi:PAS domain-containing protein
VGVLVAALMSGCTSESKDAETASILCAELRQLDNRIVEQVNASVEGINEVPEGERMDRILDGLDDVDAELLAWDRRIDVIDLPAIDERADLQRQLHSGVDAAVAELDDQRSAFESVPSPVADEDLQGVVEAWFNAVEKVFSVSEPEVFRFERTEFKQVFLDEPDCRNVIQQFVND